MLGSDLILDISYLMIFRFLESRNQKKLVVKNITSEHKNHLLHTPDEVKQMVKLKDVPNVIKDNSKELFLRGYNLSEIHPILLAKHPSSE